VRQQRPKAGRERCKATILRLLWAKPPGGPRAFTHACGCCAAAGAWVRVHVCGLEGEVEGWGEGGDEGQAACVLVGVRGAGVCADGSPPFKKPPVHLHARLGLVHGSRPPNTTPALRAPGCS
jgi:hypothetical protein